MTEIEGLLETLDKTKASGERGWGCRQFNGCNQSRMLSHHHTADALQSHVLVGSQHTRRYLIPAVMAQLACLPLRKGLLPGRAVPTQLPRPPICLQKHLDNEEFVKAMQKQKQVVHRGVHSSCQLGRCTLLCKPSCKVDLY